MNVLLAIWIVEKKLTRNESQLTISTRMTFLRMKK